MKFSLSDPAKHEATLAYSYVRYQSDPDDRATDHPGHLERYCSSQHVSKGSEGAGGGRVFLPDTLGTTFDDHIRSGSVDRTRSTECHTGQQ